MSIQPHLTVDESQVSERVIVCGEPDRVNRIASLLQEAKPVAENREFRLFQGKYRGHPITVCSTGIGAPSMLIALEELVHCGAKSIIRVGSAGALQKGIGLGELIVAEGAIRDDGGSLSYVESSYPACADFSLLRRLENYLSKQERAYHFGIVRSHDSFYRDDEAQICQKWSKKGAIASDMETSALLTVGRLRGIKVASILNNVVLYQQDVKEGIGMYVDADKVMMDGERIAAKAALEALTSIDA